MDRVAVKLAVRACAEVIFYVARAVDIFGFEAAALKLVEDRAIRLAHHVGEHVEAATVRHADDHFANAECAAAFDNLFHRRNEAFATIKAETFGAHIFDMKEFLKALGLNHLVEDRLAAFAGEFDFLVVAFDAFFQPARFFGVGNMHVLQRECATVGAAHDIKDLAHIGKIKPQNLINEDRAVHVGIGKAV